MDASLLAAWAAWATVIFTVVFSVTERRRIREDREREDARRDAEREREDARRDAEREREDERREAERERDQVSRAEERRAALARQQGEVAGATLFAVLKYIDHLTMTTSPLFSATDTIPSRWERFEPTAAMFRETRHTSEVYLPDSVGKLFEELYAAELRIWSAQQEYEMSRGTLARGESTWKDAFSDEARQRLSQLREKAKATLKPMAEQSSVRYRVAEVPGTVVRARVEPEAAEAGNEATVDAVAKTAAASGVGGDHSS